VQTYSGAGATAYDQLHRYAEEEQHEYPAAQLVTQIWAPGGYGRALEVDAGSGYFTMLLARRAESVVAVELVPDMQRVLRERCRNEGLTNVTVIGTSALDLSTVVPDGSIDSALIIQSLHHFHRRQEIFAALGRAVRPGWLVFRHFAAILAVEAQRGPRSGRPYACEENRLPKAPWAS
jgi:ubiquinone/menaquinone biosynthesis C-methylase UbiE